MIMRDETVTAFYKTPQWENTRRLYIQSVDGLCEGCLAKGIYKPGRAVHHIKHITPQNVNDPNITLSFDNLRYVCQDCHAKEHRGEKGKRRYTFDEHGNVIYKLT